MTAIQAIILAIVQGVTELFPISSLGHAVLMPAILGWNNVNEDARSFLPFLTVMHLGTAVALIGYFWRDWYSFAMAVVLRRGPNAAAERRLFWRVVVATIPAVVIGFIFEKKLKAGFGAPILAASFLILNGVMLLFVERWKGRGTRTLGQLSWRDAIEIGFWQCLALIPGLSRSGTTMAGGYLAGLNHEDAARFCFLTATPIIIGATALEAPKLIKSHDGFSGIAVVAGVVAGLVALGSVVVLMRWFHQHEVRGFDPFAAYCIVAGAGSLVWLNMVH